MAVDPADQVPLRVRIAQSWWLASELVRRNRELFVYEYHPGGGTYDCLGLFRRDDMSAGSVIDLNRLGRLHVRQPVEEPVATWLDAVTAPDPHHVLKTLEHVAGLRPGRAAPSTPEVLTYRVIARVLASVVNDRDQWDARSEAVDTSGGTGGPAGYLERFPRAQAAARAFPTLRRPFEPYSHLWALLRGVEPVALLDVHGTVHTRTATLDLMPAYRAHGSNLTRTIAAVLGEVLP